MKLDTSIPNISHQLLTWKFESVVNDIVTIQNLYLHIYVWILVVCLLQVICVYRSIRFFCVIFPHNILFNKADYRWLRKSKWFLFSNLRNFIKRKNYQSALFYNLLF